MTDKDRQPWMPCPEAKDGRHDFRGKTYGEWGDDYVCRRCAVAANEYEVDEYCDAAAARIAELEQQLARKVVPKEIADLLKEGRGDG